MARGRGRNRSNRTSARGKVRDRAQNREKGKGGGTKYNFDKEVDYFNPSKGTTILSIIPYEITVDNNPDMDKGELWYKRKIFVHYGIGVEEISIICPKTIGKRCPICEARAALIKDSYDDNETQIKQLRPSQREIFNVVDMDDDEDEILFWEIAYSNFGELLDEELEESEDGEPILGIADLDNRPVLNVRFKKAKFDGNKYLKASKVDADEGDDLNESILKEVVDLDRCLKIMDYKTLERVFLELDDANYEEDETGDEKEKEEPKKEKTRPRRTQQKEKVEDKKKQRKGRRNRKKKEENPCPAGHKFGHDCDKKPECPDCDTWSDCADELDKIEEKVD